MNQTKTIILIVIAAAIIIELFFVFGGNAEITTDMTITATQLGYAYTNYGLDNVSKGGIKGAAGAGILGRIIKELLT